MLLPHAESGLTPKKGERERESTTTTTGHLLSRSFPLLLLFLAGLVDTLLLFLLFSFFSSSSLSPLHHSLSLFFFFFFPLPFVSSSTANNPVRESPATAVNHCSPNPGRGICPFLSFSSTFSWALFVRCVGVIFNFSSSAAWRLFYLILLKSFFFFFNVLINRPCSHPETTRL